MIDKIKMIAAIGLVGASIWGFYHLAEEAAWMRAGIVILGVLIAVAIAATSTQGKAVMEFASGASVEVKKVVWPTQKETTQTTLVVLIGVVIIGLGIWAFDALAFWVIYDWVLSAVST